LLKLTIVGGVLAAGVAAVPFAYAATAPAPPTGFVKICKAGATAAVTGSFQFTVSGVTGAVTVPVGACSKPIAVTDRRVVVTEAAATGVAVTAITVKGVSTLVSSDVAKGSAVVKVASGATDVSFTNKVPGVTGCVDSKGFFKNHPAVVAKLVAANGGTLLVGGVALTPAQIAAIYGRGS